MSLFHASSKSSFAARFAPYLSGERLYGEDLDEQELANWFRDESEAYATLLSEEHAAVSEAAREYPYHGLNHFHGFRWLPKQRFPHALGFGSAHADEFRPIARWLQRITVVDPATGFAEDHCEGVPIERVMPTPGGELALATESVDLVLSLGALHHVARVSRVISEFARVMRPGAWALLREPISSMGDWSKPRVGLTLRERGIPLGLLRNFCEAAELRIERESVCLVSPWVRLCKLLGMSPYADSQAMRADALLSRALSLNYVYHRRHRLRAFAPSACFLLLRKAARR